MCHAKQEQASQLIKYRPNVSCHINDTWIGARRSKFESQESSAFLAVLITALHWSCLKHRHQKITSCMLPQKRFLRMPVAAPLSLTKTARRPGEPTTCSGLKWRPSAPRMPTCTLRALLRCQPVLQPTACGNGVSANTHRLRPRCLWEEAPSPCGRPAALAPGTSHAQPCGGEKQAAF